jgi:hypothetical protein
MPSLMLSRRQLLHSLSALTAASLLAGCGASSFHAIVSATPTLTPNPQPLPFGAMTSASLTISTTTTATFASDFIGLAYEKQTLTQPLFAARNADLIGLFGRLGTSVLRIGGNTVDSNVWTPGGPGQTNGQIAPSDVDALAAFLRSTGWRCIYGINLGGAATGATTPMLAAAEVAYVTQALGQSLVGIEIGNECYNYGDAGAPFQNQPWTVSIFETLWRQYRDAIVALTPHAPLIGPAGGDPATWLLPWSEAATRNQIGMITQHYYRGSAYASTASADDLLSPDADLAAQLILLHEGAQSVGVPFRMGECNSYWDGGKDGVSNTYASSLWALDMIFTCALGGASGVNFQGGNQGFYTPIADNDGQVLGPRPVFYGLQLAAMAGAGTLLSTNLNAGSLNVSAYAMQNTTGGISLVLVNKDATQNLDLSIALPQAATSATLQLLTQSSGQQGSAASPSLSATTGVTIQGSTITPDGTFTPTAPYQLDITGRQLSCYVPALSAALIQLS